MNSARNNSKSVGPYTLTLNQQAQTLEIVASTGAELHLAQQESNRSLVDLFENGRKQDFDRLMQFSNNLSA